MSKLGVTRVERHITTHLTAHEGYWRQLAALLRAMESEEEAAVALRRQVRNAMAYALLAGYEGFGPTPRRPRRDATNMAQQWVGMKLLRDVGPRELDRIDWSEIARGLTQLAGPRISSRPRAEQSPRTR
jgi:hypothetical protein